MLRLSRAAWRRRPALAAAGISPDYLNAHFAQLATVTADEATTSFRELIAPAALTIVATGSAADLVPALEGLGLNVTSTRVP